jgi:hypothetical protein
MAQSPATSKHQGFPLDLFGWHIVHRTMPHVDGQSVKYQAVWDKKVGPSQDKKTVTVHIEIVRNAYDEQSFARLRTFQTDRLAWSPEPLVYLSRSQMSVLDGQADNPRIPVVSYGRGPDSPAFDRFRADENALMIQAARIIEP